MPFKHKKNSFKIVRIIILSILVLLLINARDIGRLIFPIPYRQVIYREAANAGLDASLVAAIVKTESSFNPGAVSVKGARGLMQIMPQTGNWVAEKEGLQGYSPDLLFNPEYNVKIGVLYLLELNREFSGDTVLVLAAYNAGRGNVKRWLEQHSWTGEQGSIDQIPFPETRQFIRKVLFYRQVYRYLYFSAPIQ